MKIFIFLFALTSTAEANCWTYGNYTHCDSGANIYQYGKFTYIPQPSGTSTVIPIVKQQKTDKR